MGLLEYASEASIKVYFDDFSDTNKLLMHVEGLTQAQGGSTNIGTGLKKTLDLFSVKNDMRGSEVRDIGVCLFICLFVYLFVCLFVEVG